jgi:hypothetical protein
MKNTMIRLFVLSLAVAGFGASSITAHARIAKTVSVPPTSAVMPLCAPSDPSHCGLD